MGLLDDAIREHLDLKRRRGADPTEVERAEREALGPVRRGPEPVESDELLPEVGGDLPGDYELGVEPEWEEEPTAFHEPPVAPDSLLDRGPESYDAPLPRDEPEAYEHPLPDEVAPAPQRSSLEPEPLSELEPLDGPDQFAEPEPPAGTSASPAPHPAPASPHPHGDETIEYSIDEATGEKTGEKDEDVLEETPEFLQDAPEHDRLWFEQRPPRDFDFNE